MKRTLLSLALLAAGSAMHAAPWTYKGTLNDGGKPANGQYDLRLTLLNEAGTQSLVQPITLLNVAIKDGSFSAAVDFGIELADAQVMNLKTEVQQGSSGFTSLGAPERFDPKAMLAGVCWDTEGNAGTNAASNFLGTTDANPLLLRANNFRIANFMANGTAANYGDAPSIALGSSANIANGIGATVGGGGSTRTSAGALDATFRNSATALFSTVAGGSGNRARENFSTVSGGQGNTAVGGGATVGGGTANNASGSFGSVIGGSGNIASGQVSTVSGGVGNCAGGDNSWAGGSNVVVRVGNKADDAQCGPNSSDADGDNGTFAWADSQSGSFISTGPNQFLVRASGGVGINTANVGTNEMVVSARAGSFDTNLVLRSADAKTANFRVINATGTMLLSTDPNAGQNRITFTGGSGGSASLSNGGTWTNASSRSYKENFSAVNGLDILSRLVEIPIMTWDYKGSTEGLHMGPVAEDFKASFGLAGDGKSISTVDADGVALAAIQGLNAKLESENAQLRRESADLRKRMERIEQRLPQQ